MATTSPVDILFPSEKRHPRFRQVAARMSFLRTGDTLVLPPGWWWCSVATETSVTLHHPFWSLENRVRICERFWDFFDAKVVGFEEQESMRETLESVRDAISMDDGVDLEDYVIRDDGTRVSSTKKNVKPKSFTDDLLADAASQGIFPSGASPPTWLVPMAED